MADIPEAPKPGDRVSRWTTLVNVDALPTFAKGPSALTLSTTLLAQGLLMISGIIVARALGVEGRGTLALLWLVPVALVLLGGLGIPQATTYYVAKERSNTAAVVRMSATTTIAIGVTLFALYGVGLLLLGEVNRSFSATEALLSMSLIFPFLGLNLGIAVLLGLKRYRAFNFSRFVAPFLYAFGAAILLLLGDATLPAVLAVSLTSWLMAAVIAWIIVIKRMAPSRTAPDTNRRDIIGFGLRGVVGSTSPIDDTRADQLLVGILMDARALGIYVVAVAFCNLPRFVAMSVGSVAFPRIASADSEEDRWGTAIRAARIGVLTVAVFASAILLALPILIPLLFGEEFRDAIPLGRILLVAAFFLAVHRLLSELARGLGHPGYGSITEIVNGLIFVLGVLVFATPANTTGIALAVLAGGIASSALLSFLLIRLRHRSA